MWDKDRAEEFLKNYKPEARPCENTSCGLWTRAGRCFLKAFEEAIQDDDLMFTLAEMHGDKGDDSIIDRIKKIHKDCFDRQVRAMYLDEGFEGVKRAATKLLNVGTKAAIGAITSLVSEDTARWMADICINAHWGDWPALVDAVSGDDHYLTMVKNMTRPENRDFTSMF